MTLLNIQIGFAHAFIFKWYLSVFALQNVKCSLQNNSKAGNKPDKAKKHKVGVSVRGHAADGSQDCAGPSTVCNAFQQQEQQNKHLECRKD